jgi:serine/threonine-protein kinase
MGVVHKARDLKLGRLAALKFLSPHLLPLSEARARFLREARSLSSLSHPHVATVYEVGEVDGTLFLAMEYLSGGTLRARIEAAKSAETFITDDQLLDWGIGLADGLGHVHARGFMHRDIKSSNAMFDDEDRIKLTDFGLAKAFATAEETTSSGLVGTIQYMSPEQFGPGPVDHRSDLYSLGVVLYEAAARKLPFSGDTPAEVASKIVRAEVPPLSDIRPGVSAGFERVVARLLSKDLEERYQSAQDVRRDLARLKAGDLDLPAVSPKKARLSQLMRRPTIPAAVALSLVVGIAAVVVWRWPSAAGNPDYKEVLVLPLRSIGGDADQAALCDGLTETMTAALTQSGVLSVVPASDASAVATAEQARGKFGVSLVVSGSLQRRGDRVRLTLNLVDAQKARQLGVETVEASAAQPFQIEDGMLSKVAELVDVAVPRKDTELLAKRDASPKAFDAYLRGKGFLYRYDKVGNLDRAAQQFEEAIQVEPEFPLAYVGLAETRMRTYRQNGELATLSAAREAVERALQINPQLASAHAILGAVFVESDLPKDAVVELEKAIQLDPKEPSAYRELAYAYQDLGQSALADAVFKRAIRARPGDWRPYSSLAVFYFKQKRYEDAERLFRRVIQLAPDNHYGYLNLGGLLTEVGRHDEAEAMIQRSVALTPTANGWSNLGTLYMLRQQYDKAVPVLENAIALVPPSGPNAFLVWGNLGDAYWLSGAPPDKARGAYLRAIELAETTAAGHGSAELNSYLAGYYAKVGDQASARERIKSALEGSPESAPVHYEAGLVFAMLGDEQQALKELQVALDLGMSGDRLRTAPELKRLRLRDEFTDLLHYARPTS